MLHEASRREFKRILIGTLILTALMLGVFLILHFCNIIPFTLRIVLSSLGGTLVALANFYGLCLGAQKSMTTDDPKRSKAYLQASYQYRLLFQAAWCILSIAVSYINPFAALIPLLFPRIVILFTQIKGRKASEQSNIKQPLPEESIKENEDHTNESGD